MGRVLWSGTDFLGGVGGGREKEVEDVPPRAQLIDA